MGGKLRLIAEFPNRRPAAIALANITSDEPPEPKRRGRTKARTSAKMGAGAVDYYYI
jgi:hypothetical protein